MGGWLTAADFGLKLAGSLNDGIEPAGSNDPRNLLFNPYAPITVDLRGAGAQAAKQSKGLLNFSLGDSLDPSTSIGAITTGLIVGVTMLAIVAIVK